MFGCVWGLFRKLRPAEDAQEQQPVDDDVRVQQTQEVQLERDEVERDLSDGVEAGEHPGDWVDAAIASRAAREEDESPFAPPGGEADATETAGETGDAVGVDAAEFGDASDGGEAEARDDNSGVPEASAEPEPAPAPVETRVAVHVPELPERPQPLSGDELAAARDNWRGQLAKIGGPSTLTNFRSHRGTYIDLTTAHPSGVATLLAGRPVMLTSLLREPLAFRNALDAADHVARKGAELEASRGLSFVQLATGLASWTSSGGQVRCPVLLRSATLRRLGRDYEVRLRGRTHPNISLLRALYEDGVTIRASELAEALGDAGSLLPESVFELVRGRGAELPGFYVDARALLSTFGDVGESLFADADDLDHPVLDALAGDQLMRARLGGDVKLETSINPDLRDPAADRLLVDADTEQERAVDAILGGSNLVIETLPGTGLTQTVVNAVGQLVDRDRRVLIVTPRAASVREIRSRLRRVGLNGLAVTPRTLRRDTVAAISRDERAERPNTADLDDALVRLRHVLVDYRKALNEPDNDFGVAPFDVLERLSSLELLDVPPSTTARLRREVLVDLRDPERREQLAERLRELSRLGAFRFGPDDSPWYGVVFSSTEEVSDMHSAARELADGRVSDAIAAGRGLIGQTNLTPPESFAQLGVYLRLLADIRETLDRFINEVFDANLPQLIEATGPRRDGHSMPASRRRELRAMARELVRPGVAVNDLHEALKYVHRQRILWHRHVADGALPNVPVGIEPVREQYRVIADRLRPLDDLLGDSGISSLADGPIDELQPRLEALAAGSEVLDNVVERLQLSERLRMHGLGELLDDLLDRHIGEAHVGDELEQAWWQSVLEYQLQEHKALLNANTRVLTRLENDFRVVDEAHTASSAAQLVWQLAQAWKIGLVDYADEAEALRNLLRASGVNSRALVEQAPHLSRSIAQVWIVNPYEIPRIDDRIQFDTVLLVDAGDMSTAEAIGAIRRASQVVAFGDPVTQIPAPFSIAVQTTHQQQQLEHTTDEIVAERVADSIYARLAEFLPRMSLTRSYRTGGEDLVDLVNERFYEGRLETMPWAGAFLGYSSLTYSYVADGTGLPDEITGAVEATDAEVTRVVELVLDHALHRPRESLMVVTASAIHAQRVEQAVWSSLTHRQQVVDFFTGPRNEPFLVTTIERSGALARDRVIFSLGYGKTPHGRVLSEFGVLAKADGERSLAVAMTRARRSLVIVTCVRPSEFDVSRMTSGTVGLAEILNELEQRTEQPGKGAALDATSAPMLVDLGNRLTSYGMRVEFDYRGRIPLAASYGNRAIAIDLDVRGPSAAQTLREQLRLRPELLKRLGWYYLRVHAFELFANPASVAERIAVALEVPMPTDEDEIAGELERGAAANAVPPLESHAVQSRPALPAVEPRAAEVAVMNDPATASTSSMFEASTGVAEAEQSVTPRSEPDDTIDLSAFEDDANYRRTDTESHE